MKPSSSMCQIVHSNLFVPFEHIFNLGKRVLSLPSINNTEADQYDNRAEVYEQHPASCMIESNVILGAKTCFGYINSSHSSSSTSLPLSDNINIVHHLSQERILYNSEDFTNDPAISLNIPSFSSKLFDSSDDVTVSSTPIDRTEDDNSFSTSSSLSPSHQLGVPSKAASVLGAQEMFTSPSHAAYRRLVDFTHRSANDGQSLLHTDAPYPPSLAHPSLTARPHRKSKSDGKPLEASPEKKMPSKYKIISIGIDDVREKLNFLRKPGDHLTSSGTAETISTKVSKIKDTDKLMKATGTSMRQIKKWSNSFEELLHDKYGLALFHEYLKSEYSEENIEFWIACEEYKTIANPKKMATRAHRIIKDFVATQATKEINLDSKTRQLTLENISRPNSKLFETAQKRIQTLMEIDSYQRFLRSSMYQSLLQDVRNASLTNDNPNSPPASVRTDRSALSTCVSNSSVSSIDTLDPETIHSLRDLRSPGSTKRSTKHGNHSSIIRISSVKACKNDNSSEQGIPPSSSEHCLKHTTR